MSEFNSTNRRIKRYIIKKTHKWLFAGEPVKRERFQEYVKPEKQSSTRESTKEEKHNAAKSEQTENIKFGGYDWRVLDIQNNQALLLSESILEKRLYNDKKTDITWENCTLRNYLNNDFYNKLTDSDKGRIVKKTIPNKDNQWYGTSGGKDTPDHIFLLSLEEVVQYFGDSGQLKNKNPNNKYLIDDEYNEKRIAKDTSGAAAWWWLRSPGGNTRIAADVNEGGFVFMSGDGVSASGGVRPALWLNL